MLVVFALTIKPTHKNSEFFKCTKVQNVLVGSC